MASGYIDLPVEGGGGTVDLTTGVTGVLPIANGGTNNSSTYTAGSIPFSNGTSLTQDNSNLFWDNTNKRLGIGTGATTPSAPIDIHMSTNPAFQATSSAAYGSTSGANITVAADTGAAVTSGAKLGGLNFNGATNASASILPGAYLEALSTESWSATARGSSLNIYTTPNTTTTKTLAVTVGQDQSFGVTSASTTSLTVGPNGTTNPVLQIDSSTASQANGLKITGTAAAAGVTVAAVSSNANEGINLTSKGAGAVAVQVGGVSKYTASSSSNVFSVSATSAITNRFQVNANTDTALTASSEATHTHFNLSSTRQHATGALSLQRDFRVTPSLHSFVGASTLTNAAAFSVDGPSNGSTNATITNSSALYIPTSALTNVTNSYGLNVAATTGATNNYAGIFTGGNVGIGLASPVATLDVTGTQNITSASATSLTVGPNGTTNPVLQIDSSTASQATGIKVTGAAAAGGVSIAVISSGTNENINIEGKGAGQVVLKSNGLAKFTATPTQNGFTQAANSAAATARFLVTGAADASLTASTEAPHTYFDIGQTRQHATGAITLQRDFRIRPSIHSFVGASTITDSAAFSVDGPSNASTNATVTNSSAIYVPSASISNTTNTYGLNISAATGGTNNYAATFQTGNVGMGTATPATNLEVKSLSAGANSTIRVSNDGSATGNSVISFYRVASDFGEVKYVPGGGANTGMYYNSGRTAVDSHHTFQVNGSDKMRIDNTGSLVIGSITANANAILDVQSTTKAFMPPRMTTTQKNAIASPTAGMVVYDATLAKLCIYTTAWETITSV